MNPVLKQIWSQYVAICCNDSTYVWETTHITQQENKSPQCKFSTAHALLFDCPFQLICFDYFDLCIIHHLCFITNIKVMRVWKNQSMEICKLCLTHTKVVRLRYAACPFQAHWAGFSNGKCHLKLLHNCQFNNLQYNT